LFLGLESFSKTMLFAFFYTHFIYNQDRADVIKTTWALIQQLILFDKLPIGMHTKILTVMALTAVSKSQGNRRGG